MKLIKCSDRKEIFELINETKHWWENWDTFLYYAKKLGISYQQLLNQVETIPFDKLKSYPVGLTSKVTTTTDIDIGKEPDEIFYPDEPEVPVRKMTVLGTCLSGCEYLARDIGCDTIIGNGYYWGDYDLFESLGGKSIINLKPKPVTVPTKDFIRRRMDEWIARPGCGGWWCDNGIRGEEPDGQRQKPREAEKKMLADRAYLYEVISEHDPDRVKRPVFEQFNMTEAGVIDGDWRSGWKGQYSEDPMTCDVNLWTCYTASQGTRDAMYEAQAKWFDLFPGKYMTGKVQLIPQVSVEYFWSHGGDNSVKAAYENWKKIFRNNSLVLGGMAYYSWLLIRENPKAQAAIREVNQEIIRR